MRSDQFSAERSASARSVPFCDQPARRFLATATLTLALAVTAGCGSQTTSDTTFTPQASEFRQAFGSDCGEPAAVAGMIDDSTGQVTPEAAAPDRACAFDADGAMVTIVSVYGDEVGTDAAADLLQQRVEDAVKAEQAARLVTQASPSWVQKGPSYYDRYQLNPYGSVDVRGDYYYETNDGDPNKAYVTVKMTANSYPGRNTGGGCSATNCWDVGTQTPVIDGNKFGGSYTLYETSPGTTSKTTNWTLSLPWGLSASWNSGGPVSTTNQANPGAVDAKWTTTVWAYPYIPFVVPQAARGTVTMQYAARLSAPESYTYYKGGMYQRTLFVNEFKLNTVQLYIDRYYQFNK